MITRYMNTVLKNMQISVKKSDGSVQSFQIRIRGEASKGDTVDVSFTLPNQEDFMDLHNCMHNFGSSGSL